jgi:hypothetical protein
LIAGARRATALFVVSVMVIGIFRGSYKLQAASYKQNLKTGTARWSSFSSLLAARSFF